MSKIFDRALAQVSDESKNFIDSSFDIANQIHAILERQGKTQRDLANALGKKESEISKWLTGTHNFTLKSISKIAAILNERIITTPLESQKDFLRLAEKAMKLFEGNASDYFALNKPETPVAFVEVSRNTKVNRAASGEVAGEQDQFYAMVA